MAGLEDIGFRVMTVEDEAAARKIFYEGSKREPLCMGIAPRDLKIPLDKVLPGVLGNGLSYCAYDTKTGAVIGIRLCIVEKKGDPALRRDHPVFDINNPETKKVARLEIIGKLVHDGIDIYELYQTNVFVRFYGLYVKESYGRRGIGRRLVEESLHHVHQKGYSHVLVKADSNHSISIFKNLNFEQVSETYFDEMYENGERLMKYDTGEHKKVSHNGEVTGAVCRSEQVIK